MKEVLIIYYTQSGQQLEILKNVAKILHDEQINITWHSITPKKDFNFPWTSETFFGAFPETYKQVPVALELPQEDVLSKNYDLIILGYQVWYLTPSIPINSFLKSDAAKIIMANTPVVTIIGCRNMWMTAQEKMKVLLKNINARLVGNIALVDRHQNHISVITIAHWMFGGKKTRYLGIFPKPGVSQEDIENASRFGSPIKDALLSGSYKNLQNSLLKKGAVTIKPFLITVDKRANVIFSKWSSILIKKGKPGSSKRKKWVKVFKFYLLFAIWIISPLVFIVFLVTYLPNLKRIKKDKEYFSSIATKDN